MSTANQNLPGKPKAPAAFAPAAGSTARTHEADVRLELYNAAVAYAQYVMGDGHDYESAMKTAQRLEDAADAFANR